jgi:signal transduction histidine kinase
VKRPLTPTLHLLRIAGALAWIAVGVQLGFLLARAPLADASRPLWLAIGAWLLFAAASRGFAVTPPATRRRGIALAAVASLAAVILPLADAWRGPNVALFVIVAAQLASLVSPTTAVIWVLAQTLVAIAPWLVRQPLIAVIASAAAVAFQLFGLAALRLFAGEQQARQELASANAELRAVQPLLDQSSRMAERLRIARELHDVIGHHLTALSVNLDLASRLSADGAAEPVGRARTIARDLLAQVRQVVGTAREETVLDLRPALRALAGQVSEPRIHIAYPDDLPLHLTDPERAQTVLRCVQEIVTNALRHAAARNVWIEITREGETLRIQGRDDGRGAIALRPGHGLLGMRERLESTGGRLEIAARPGAGVELTAVMPLAWDAP